MATSEAITPDDDRDVAGFLIVHVLLNLLERVVALEERREARVRPIIGDDDDSHDARITRDSIDREMVRLHRAGLSQEKIGQRMGYDVKTVRNKLKRAAEAAAKKEIA